MQSSARLESSRGPFAEWLSLIASVTKSLMESSCRVMLPPFFKTRRRCNTIRHYSIIESCWKIDASERLMLGDQQMLQEECMSSGQLSNVGSIEIAGVEYRWTNRCCSMLRPAQMEVFILRCVEAWRIISAWCRVMCLFVSEYFLFLPQIIGGERFRGNVELLHHFMKLR